MAATTNVQVIITGKDNASSVLKGVGRSFDNLGNKVTDSLKTIGTFGLIGVAGLAAFATKAAFSSARVEELGFALNAIAKANKISQREVDKTVDALRGFNIAHDKALEITSLFIQSQLDLSDATKLATVAKDLAVLASVDSSEATKLLTRAIVTQRPILLKQFGIQKGLVEIYDDYADSVGKVAEELTEAEKKQAFLNTILIAGKDVAGVYEASMGSVSKRFRSLTGRIIPDFMAKIGKAFQPALTAVVDAIADSIGNLSKWIDDNQETLKRWAQTSENVSKQIIKSMGAIVDFLLKNKEIIVGVLVAFALGIGAVVTAFLIAKAVLIGVFAAIVFNVVFLMKTWQKSWKDFKKTLRIVSDFLTNKFVPAVERAFTDIEVAVTTAFTTIKDTVTKIIDKIKAKWEEFRTKVETVVNKISSTIRGLSSAFSSFAESFKKDAEGTLTKSADKLVLVMATRIETITDGWMSGFDSMVNTTADWAVRTEAAIDQGLTDTVVLIDTWITETIVSLDAWVQETLDGFFTWADKTVKAIEKGLDEWLVEMDKGLDEMFLSLNTFFTELPDKMLEWLDKVWEEVKIWWEELGKNTKEAALKGFEKERKNWIIEIAKFLGIVFALAIALLAAELIDLGIKWIKLQVKGAFSLNKWLTEEMAKLIIGAFNIVGKIGTGIFNFGKKIITKLVAGIKAAPKAIGNAILSMIPNATLRAGIKKAIPGLAHGTDFFQGGPAIVGERGPELVSLPRGAKVTPTDKLPMGNTFNLTVNIGTMIDSDTTRRNFAEKLLRDFEDLAAMQGKQTRFMT